MNGVHLRSDGKRLRGYCEEWQKDWSDESGKAQKIQRVDGKHACHLNNASDSLVRTLNLEDGDNYPNIQKRLETASVSQIGSTEAEYAASGIRRLENEYRSAMTSVGEGNLNLIQLQPLVEFDVWK